MPQSTTDQSVPSIDGVSIGYSVTGSGEPALVFVHCWLCNRSFWDGQVSVFEKRYSVVTMDLGGHGTSGVNRQDWSIPAFANDVLAVVEILDSQKVVLVAHSMGGPVALEVAKKSPERIAAIVFVDTLHDMDLKPTPAHFEAMMEPFKKDYGPAVQEAFRTRLAPPHDPKVLDWIVEQAMEVDPAIGIGAMEGMAKYDVRAAATAVNLPLRAINGSLRATNREANKQHLRDYDLVVMEGTGHFPHLEKPDEFNLRLQETLDRLGLGRAKDEPAPGRD